MRWRTATLIGQFVRQLMRAAGLPARHLRYQFWLTRSPRGGAVGARCERPTDRDVDLVATAPESMRQAVFGAFDTPVSCELAVARRRALQQADVQYDGARYAVQCQLAARNGPLPAQLDAARMIRHLRIALELEPVRRPSPLISPRLVALQRGRCDSYIHPDRSG